MNDEQIKAAAAEVSDFIRDLVKQWVEFRGHEGNIAAIIKKHNQPINEGAGTLSRDNLTTKGETT